MDDIFLAEISLSVKNIAASRFSATEGIAAVATTPVGRAGRLAFGAATGTARTVASVDI